MKKPGYSISDKTAELLEEALADGRVLFSPGERDQLQSLSYHLLTKGTGSPESQVEISFDEGLTSAQKRTLLSQEIQHLRTGGKSDDMAFLDAMRDTIKELAKEKKAAELSVSSLIIPERKTKEGVLVKSASYVWEEIVRALGSDWRNAFEITDRKWEEIIAGAFHRAGYEEVILTPRSRDFGRDVIAIKRGVGCIKIIGSVKAYRPGHLVEYDAVRSLIGVLSGERDASKGIITTTSAFPRRIRNDPFIAPFLPYRLELMDGSALQAWLKGLLDKKD